VFIFCLSMLGFLFFMGTTFDSLGVCFLRTLVYLFCLSILLVPLGYVWKLLIPEADTSTMRGSVFTDTFSCLGTDTRPSAVNLRFAFWSLCSGKTASPWDRLFLLLSGNHGYVYSCSGTKPAVNLVSVTITGPLYVNMVQSCVCFLLLKYFKAQHNFIR
jgi:hypothetical protein